MHIYTKSGDKGETGMMSGSRISKNSLLAHAIGDLDEFNSSLAMLRSLKPPAEIEVMLRQSQDDIYVIAAILADPEKKSNRTPKLDPSRTAALEKQIDAWENVLPHLKNFILPGGSSFAARVHLARTICRRAERNIIALHERSILPPEILQYMNRLSDFLFTLARWDNFQKKVEEIIWKP